MNFAEKITFSCLFCFISINPCLKNMFYEMFYTVDADYTFI